jgi:hypothetical protein
MARWPSCVPADRARRLTYREKWAACLVHLGSGGALWEWEWWWPMGARGRRGARAVGDAGRGPRATRGGPRATRGAGRGRRGARASGNAGRASGDAGRGPRATRGAGLGRRGARAVGDAGRGPRATPPAAGAATARPFPSFHAQRAHLTRIRPRFRHLRVVGVLAADSDAAARPDRVATPSTAPS